MVDLAGAVPSPDADVEHLRAATRIEVRTNTDRLLREVTDVGVVADVVAALAALPDPWVQPTGGVPVATRRFDFHGPDGFLGNVGVSRSFLTMLWGGGFCAYGLSDPSIARSLLRAVDVDQL